MTPPTITAAWLARRNACAEQVTLFRAAFGDAAPVTTETLAQAHAAGLNLGWLASRVLTYAARAEYDRVRASALAEYDRVRASAWAEYDRVRASAWAEFQRVTASAWAEFQRVTASALVALLANPANWRDGWDA